MDFFSLGDLFIGIRMELYSAIINPNSFGNMTHPTALPADDLADWFWPSVTKCEYLSSKTKMFIHLQYYLFEKGSSKTLPRSGNKYVYVSI